MRDGSHQVSGPVAAGAIPALLALWRYGYHKEQLPRDVLEAFLRACHSAAPGAKLILERAADHPGVVSTPVRK